MSTIKQTTARRKNAIRSQGPKTEQGKAASSRNALTFGFFSRDPLIPGEDAAEWNKFRSDLLASLAPLGAAQAILADRIVDSAWRLRRFAVVEAGIFTARLYQEEESLAKDVLLEIDLAKIEADIDDLDDASEPDEREKRLTEIGLQALEASEAPETSLGRAFIRDSKETTAFLKLGRYEAGIERALCRNLQLLERLQAIQVKGVRKNPASVKKVKLQNDPAEDLSVTDRAA